MNKIEKLCIVLFLCIFTNFSFSEDWSIQDDWGKYFQKESVTGTIVVIDQRTEKRFIYNQKRALKSFSPASTFKIPHTLFALDAGVVQDEFQNIEWDGVERTFQAWNKDQTLRQAMSNSTIWVYQKFANDLGEKREKEYLQRIRYGNMNPSGDIKNFWLDGTLRISAVEQVEFLMRLYLNELPFKVEHQRLVKDIMINEAQKEWMLRAKTGWGTPDNESQVGWWVGWLETSKGAVFFALNIEMPNGIKDAVKRQRITKAILKSINALPADA